MLLSSNFLSRPIFEQHFYCPKERWGQQTSGQFKGTEEFYSLSSFQNGGFVFGKRTTFTKWLDAQSRSEGCLLLYTHALEFTEETTFWMGRFSLSVPLSLFRVIPSPIGIYKTTESSSSYVKKTESEVDYLSRRYFAGSSINRRIRDREGDIDFSITISRLPKQCEKVCILPKNNYRIP